MYGNIFKKLSKKKAVEESTEKMKYSAKDSDKIKGLLARYGLVEGKFKDYQVNDGKFSITFKSPLQRNDFMKDLKQLNIGR